MILTEKVVLKISPATNKYYRDLGYVIFKNKETEILSKDLSKNSIVKVNVECDICKSQKIIVYREYLRNIKNGGYYTCNNCKNTKIKKTMIEKYGVESALQLDNFKEKAAETCFKKYGNRNYKNYEKSKLTNLEKLGKEFPFQCELIKEKIKNTNLNKYGMEFPSQRKEIREKIKNTNLYRYGVENPLQFDEFKLKSIQTNLNRYGVENPTQNQLIFDKQRISSYKTEKYKNLFYKGTYELDFLINFSDKFEIKKPKSIDYFFENKKRKYYPDFYIPSSNLIIEIKSNYTYNCNVEMNESKKRFSIENGYNFLFIIDKNYEEFRTFVDV